MKMKGYVKSGVNYLDKESYFIRLKDSPTVFLHFEGDNPENKEEVKYVFKEGPVGAAVFLRKKAESFMRKTGIDRRGAELASVRKVLGADSSMN